MTAPSITTDLIAYNFNIETSDFFAHLKNAPLSPLIGQSFMHELARDGDTLSAEVILQTGGHIDLPDDEGRRPLHEAAFFGKLEMVKLLVANGAVIDAPIHPFGYTALYLAIQQGRHDVARFLIENGARLSVIDHLSGQGLLHIAAARGDVLMTGLLVAAGIDVFAQDKRGQTARDYAAKAGERDLERILLKIMVHHARFCA